MPNYGDPVYWNKRYKEQEGMTFDWLEDYASLKTYINDMIPKTARILVIGCGNSEFSEKMFDDGYEHIDNIDQSEVVINQMKIRNANRKSMTYAVMDARDLHFPDNSYDLVFDKCLLDSVLCGKKAFYNAALVVKEVQRVLKTNAFYMVISYGKSENRLLHLQREHLSFDIKECVIGIKPGEKEDEENSHYMYLCKKRFNAADICKKNWNKIEEDLRKEYEDEMKLMEDVELDFDGMSGIDFDDENEPETTKT